MRLKILDGKEWINSPIVKQASCFVFYWPAPQNSYVAWRGTGPGPFNDWMFYINYSTELHVWHPMKVLQLVFISYIPIQKATYKPITPKAALLKENPSFIFVTELLRILDTCHRISSALDFS